MKETDQEMVLRWRNSDRVRRYFLNDHIIEFKDHLEWYQNMCNNPDCEWLIAEYLSVPIGVVYITDINRRDSTCTWGLYVGENIGNLGVGVLMEVSAIDHIVSHHGIRKIWGMVLESNRIILTHKKFGFVEEGVLRSHVLKNGKYEDIILVALFTEQWPTKRKELISTFNL